MKNIILGVLLEMPDPQRDNFVLNSNDYIEYFGLCKIDFIYRTITFSYV